MISERAYEELRERIVTLRLAPGTVLREDELMRELEIGRTPLREAVKRLALENLVAVQPRIGTYVTSVDVADIVHISEVAPSSRRRPPSSPPAASTTRSGSAPRRCSSRSSRSIASSTPTR